MSARPPRRTAVLTEATSYTLHLGDCLEVLRTLSDASVDAVVTDPPYELGFMGKGWDASGIAFNPEVWRECLRVLKPGGHLLAFGGTRTYHRMTVAIEDGGFEIRDCLSWQYGSGFPKSLDVSKAIDKAAGAEREVVGRSVYGDGHIQNSTETIGFGGCDPSADQRFITAPATDDAKRWAGWGTALKPAWEPIVVARKPLEGTVAANVLKHGTGALNIDATRITTADNLNGGAYSEGGRAALPGDEREGSAAGMFADGGGRIPGGFVQPSGRWPANLILSHGADCGEGKCAPGCPCAALDAQSGVSKSNKRPPTGKDDRGVPGFVMRRLDTKERGHADAGGASRFFNQLPIDADDLVPFLYVPKASRSEREAGCDALPARTGAEAVDRAEGSAGLTPRAGAGRSADKVRNHHPTVKPVSVMRWCARLVTPPGGVVLDPFMGSGTTGIAAENEGFRFIGIERELEYIAIAKARIAHARPSMDVSQKTE